MNIYDMLRAFANSASMSAHEVADSLNLIDKFEKLNVFGTIARVTAGHHPFDPVHQRGRIVCAECGKTGPECQDETVA
jgi:hypothetical protein